MFVHREYKMFIGILVFLIIVLIFLNISLSHENNRLKYTVSELSENVALLKYINELNNEVITSYKELDNEIEQYRELIDWYIDFSKPLEE